MALESFFSRNISFLEAVIFYCIVSVLQVVASSYCKSPPESWTTSHNGTKDTVYPEGTVLVYGCSSGYSVKEEGFDYRVCQEDGTWSGIDSVCRIRFLSLFIALMAFVAVVLIFVILISLFFIFNSRRRKRRPLLGDNHENSTSTIAMTPRSSSSFYNNNGNLPSTKGSFQNGSLHNGSIVTSDEDNTSPRPGSGFDYVDIPENDSVSPPPAGSPPPPPPPPPLLGSNQAMPTNNQNNQSPAPPPPPPPSRPENISELLRTDSVTSFGHPAESSGAPPPPKRPENVSEILRTDSVTSFGHPVERSDEIDEQSNGEIGSAPAPPPKPEHSAAILRSDSVMSYHAYVFQPNDQDDAYPPDPPEFNAPPPPSEPAEEADLIIDNTYVGDSQEEPSVTIPTIVENVTEDTTNTEQDQSEPLYGNHQELNPRLARSKTYVRQGDGWVHDDASFDSYGEEESEEVRQHRAAIDAAL